MSAPTDPLSRTTAPGAVPGPRPEAEQTEVRSSDVHGSKVGLFLLEDLEEVGITSELTESDVDALHAVADWIRAFVVRPHEDLGRSGPVCPFVPGSLERKTLWLAPERIADRSGADVVELMSRYKSRLLDNEPTDGEASIYKVIVVVFTDLSAERAQRVFDDVQDHIAVSSYIRDGVVFGPFYEGNAGTAIYNKDFRPFQSPVPFLFVRKGVIDDWKFFLDKPDWLDYWAHRFGDSGVHALAEELRRLQWRTWRS